MARILGYDDVFWRKCSLFFKKKNCKILRIFDLIIRNFDEFRAENTNNYSNTNIRPTPIQNPNGKINFKFRYKQKALTN